MSILNHEWSSDAKLAARQSTIIDPYRKIFFQSLPVGDQYWAMCGKLYRNDRTINPVSEYGQMITSNLIKPDQFHGVEIVTDVHNINKSIYPEVNLYNNDFYEQMVIAHSENNFRPAIVNADLVHLPENAAKYAAKVIALLSSVKKTNILLVCNLILDNPRASIRSRKNDIEKFVVTLAEEPRWKFHKDKWNYEEKCYRYGGNGSRSNSNMCTYLFWRK